MTQAELEKQLEERKKRREALTNTNGILSIKANEETGKEEMTTNFDNMPRKQLLSLESRLGREGFLGEEYNNQSEAFDLAKQQADKTEKSLLETASRETLVDFYRTYSDELNRAVSNNDLTSYYKNKILLSRIRNQLGESATPLTYISDFGAELTSNFAGAIADTANLAALGYISATDNLDANVLYDVAKGDKGTLEKTLNEVWWGKDNLERLEKLREQHPIGEAHDIIETFYNVIAKQGFKGDKSYFDTTVKYLNNLSNTERYNQFQREHTLDETQARENLKIREEMSYDELGKFGLNVAGTISYMAPSILAGAGVGALAKGGVTVGAKQLVKGLSENATREVARQVGLATMSSSVAGQSATASLNEGYDFKKSLSKGIADGLLSYLTEIIGGESLNKLLVGTNTAVTPLGRLIGKGVDKLGIKNKWLRLGFGVIGDISAEALEEMTEEAISPLIEKAIQGKDITDWEKYGQDMLNAGLQSILPTLILGGFNRAQVSQRVKAQMKAMTLVTEMSPYITKEQKEKILVGIAEAYDNASHFLVDDQSEEQYNQVVKDVYKTLKEALPRYNSATDLVNVLKARINQQQNIEVVQANIPAPLTASRINIPTPPTPNQANVPTLPTTSSEDVAPTQGNQSRQLNEKQQEYLKGAGDLEQKQTSASPNKITANRSLDYIRDFKEVGKRSINAYQYDNPEVKPFFQYEAYQLLNDLNNSIRGERYATEDEYGNLIWGGNKRNTVSDIAKLLDGEDGVKLSYADIRKGLEAIIKDEGSENIAAAKRIEMVLDRRLREGYTDIEGYNHDPSENYKKFLNGEEYVAPEQYDYEQLVKEYGEPGANVDNTLSSLSEEEAREVSNYIDEIYADAELDDEYKTNIANRLTNVENFEEYKNIKNEVDNYKKQIQAENRSVAKTNEVIPKEVPEEVSNQESTQEMPQVNANTPTKYVPKTKRKLLEDFEHVGYIDVNGKVIKSADDLADLAQIFRDPTVETFRILLTGEDKKVLTQLAYTSYLPDRVDLNASTVIDEINSAIKKLNANKLWLLHNHPTGDVTPSKADQTTTTEIISKLPKGLKRLFGGHVIIDHNKYSLITQNSQMPDGIEVKSDIPLRKETFNNIEDHFSKEGWVGFKIGAPDTVAEIASDINNNPNYSTLVFVDTKLKAVALQEVPNKFLNNTDKYINNYLKRLGRQNGAAKVFVASQSSDVISNLANKNLNIQDAVLYEQTEDSGLRVVASNLRDSKMKGNEIFVDREPARKLTAKKDTPSLRATPDEEKETLKTQNRDLEKELRASKRENEKAQRENKNLQNKIQKQQETFKKQKEQLNTKMENELQKQKEAFEKRTERTKKATEAREEKAKETRTFNKLSPEKKLDKLVPKAEQQLEDYAKAEYPKLSEDFEKKFGTTIREIISALSNNKIMSQLPDKLKELITNYKNETYLKANWKTFDKYLKEAIAEKQVQDIINNSNTPVSDRLLRLLESHKQAPVIMQSAADLKEELNDLVELVNAVKASLTFAKSNEKIDKVRENIRKELEPIIEKNQKNHLSKNEKIDNVTNILGKIGKSVGEVLSYLPTRIQMLMDGNPNSALKILWDNVERGSETEMRLEVEKDRLFSKFFENPNDINSKLKGELQKDFARDNWEDTKTPLGRLTRLMMMSIYGMTMSTDNLMHITPVLLGVTESGTPVYSKPGGLIIPEERAYKRGDIATAYANGKTVALTMEDIKKITSMLTPLEKEFVKTCVQDLADLVAKNGNPVSMNLAGRELFHPNYLRIIVSGDALEPEIIDPNAMDNMNTFLSSMDTGLEGRLGRGGSLQARTHKSTRPIYLEDLWNATIRSFEGAKKYISYAEALYDNDLVLKTKFPNTYKKVGTITEAEAKGKTFGDRKYVEVEELPKHGEKTYIIKNGDNYDVYELDQRGRTMESLIDSAGDDKFMKYYKDFVHQLLYGVNSYANDLDKLIGKAAGLRAKVVLHANLNVGFSQQLSRPFIMPFLDQPTKSFIQGFMNKQEVYKMAEDYLRNEGKSISGLSKRQVVNRYLEYSTYMNSYRDIGNVTHDTDFNKPRKTGLGRVDLGKLISINDRMAVDFTFRVLIQDIKNSGFEPGTKEFMQELKRRAWQVARSNPSYLAIYRTPLQMSRTAVARSFAQFQTVMLLGFNNTLSNIMASNYYKNSGNKEKAKEYGKRARISVGALIASSLLGAAIRRLLEVGFRKEKKDKLAEEILKDTVVKTLSYTIFLDDVLQWFMGEGFDASTNDLGYINQIKDMLEKFGKMITADESKKPSSTINFLKSIGNVVGAPSNSLENIFVLIGNITGSDFGKEYEVIKDSSKLKKWLDNQEALKDTDMATFYDLYIATRKDQLESKYEYIVDSKAGTYNSKALAMKRAIADTLGYNPKRLSERQQKEVNNYYEIFK